MEAIQLAILLQPIFNLNLARAKCLSALIIAIITGTTVNLSKLSAYFPGKATQASKYRRIQRFFLELKLDADAASRFIYERLPLDRIILAMDRTNWQIVGKNINILYVSIIYDGTSIPIMFKLLDKKGNSDQDERIELMEQFKRVLGFEKVDMILADREFVGHKWFSYLHENNIKIRIRAKKNTSIENRHRGFSPAKNFARSLRVNEYVQLSGRRTVWGLKVYVTIMRLEKELLIILSMDKASATEVLADYKKRWQIETMFKALKSKGFNFEEMNLVDDKKIEKLIIILSLAYCWAYLVGIYKNEQKPIKLKTHKRKECSIFRYGLNALREVLCCLDNALSDRFGDLVAVLFNTGVQPKCLL